MVDVDFEVSASMDDYEMFTVLVVYKRVYKTQSNHQGHTEFTARSMEILTTNLRVHASFITFSDNLFNNLYDMFNNNLL